MPSNLIITILLLLVPETSLQLFLMITNLITVTNNFSTYSFSDQGVQIQLLAQAIQRALMKRVWRMVCHLSVELVLFLLRLLLQCQYLFENRRSGFLVFHHFYAKCNFQELTKESCLCCKVEFEVCI